MLLKVARFAKLAPLAIALAAFGKAAAAQTTIFNIPTTDVVAKGKGYFEFGYLAQAPSSGTTRNHIFNPRFVVGIAHNFEIGANLFTAHSTHGVHYCGVTSTCGYFQPNIKFKYYDNLAAGVALSAGILWNTPINQRSAQDSWGFVYANISKKVKPVDYGPRFHAGPYGVLGANQDPLDGPTSFLSQPRAGAILGYEQPIHANARIVADWFSGKHGLGYFTPGVSITLPRNGLLNIGYSIGNDSYSDPSNHNRYLFLYYSITFP